MTFNLTYQRAEGPTGRARPGTVALQNHILETWEPARSLGIYNPRRIRGGTSWSMHAEGRAVDIGVSLTPAGEEIGDQIATWLINNAPQLGVQYFIWNRQSWTHARGWRAYRGVSPHRDHLHIEQTRVAADQLTPGDIAALAVTIPLGPAGRQHPEFDPPVVIGEALVSWAARPSGGVWALGESGSVYALDAPYHGGPRHELRDITYDVLGVPVRIEADGDNAYTVITDLGYVYGYAP